MLRQDGYYLRESRGSGVPWSKLFGPFRAGELLTDIDACGAKILPPSRSVYASRGERVTRAMLDYAARAERIMQESRHE